MNRIPKGFGVALQLLCCIVKTPRRPHDRCHHGWVAQLAEQWTENPRVGGSIPPPATPFFIGKAPGKPELFILKTGERYERVKAKSRHAVKRDG